DNTGTFSATTHSSSLRTKLTGSGACCKAGISARPSTSIERPAEDLSRSVIPVVPEMRRGKCSGISNPGGPAMTLDLPQPIADYFTAEKANGEAVSQCFTEDSVVKDEGHTYRGRTAIKQWKTQASAKYQYTSEPFACETKSGNIEVTSRL